MTAKTGHASLSTALENLKLNTIDPADGLRSLSNKNDFYCRAVSVHNARYQVITATNMLDFRLMISYPKHNNMVNLHFLFWILILIVPLNGCENDSSSNNDYTGQIDSIIDIDGNHYKTIGIGTQIWMQENLRVTHLSNGNKIPLQTERTFWRDQGLHSLAMCWYNNDSITNRSTFGGLYNYYAVETGLLCPTGWHVSSEDDWNTLVEFIGGRDKAGGILKSQNGHWISPVNYIDNHFNFSGLAAGLVHVTGMFIGLGYYAGWWTNKISQEDAEKVLIYSIRGDQLNSTREYIYKNEGSSVRCVKNK